MGFFGNKEDAEEEEEEEKTYAMEVECDNCGVDVYLNIPFGVKSDKHLKEKQLICEECGCPIYDDEE